MLNRISICNNNKYYNTSFGRLSDNPQAAKQNIVQGAPRDNEPVKVSLLAINDVHGKMTNMERIYSISKQFDRMVPPDCDKLKLASGDIMLGANLASNQVASNFLNWCGITACALGNHELDMVPEERAKIMEDAKYKLLAINATVDKSSPMYGRTEKSIIEEHNGHRYGIIGIAPSDVMERVKLNDSLEDFKIDDINTTIRKVQAEIDRLKNEEGINKIIILSHSGLDNDIKLINNTSGIDIIHSAHTHELIEGVTKGKNLFFSKTGEPVILTEYGKDGEQVGILNVEFDKDGVITKVQNNTVKTRQFNRTLPARHSVERIIGKPEVLGRVSKAPLPPQNRLIEYNPHGGFVADAVRSELDTDIAVINAGNIRGNFTAGREVDSRLLSDICPFEDKIWVNKLSEKDLVDAIKVGAKSLTNTGNKPGILYFSGMKYKINDKGELLSLTYIDKQGNEHPIDINNPDTERKYTVAADDFFATGGDNYMPANKNPDFVIKKYDFDKNILAMNYIKKLSQPFEIIDDKRVEILPS